MALPGSGNPISISQLRVEVCSSSGSLRALSALAGKSTPDAMSEFVGYSHPFSGTTFTIETYDGANGFSSLAAACADPDGGTSTTAYSNSSSITVGTALHVNKCLDQYGWLYSYDTAYPYYRIGTNIITFENWDATYTGYVVRTVQPCVAAATIEYEYYAYSSGYQYSTVYYNSTSDFNEFSRVKGATTLSPSSQSISVEAYDQNGLGANIDYYLNGVYQTSYSQSSYTNTGNISTSAGNAYRFVISTGAF